MPTASVPSIPLKASPQSQYLRGVPEEKSVILGAPPLRDISEDIRRGWTPAAARTIDALQNNGWIAGGVEAAISMIIGTGLRLNATPDFEALGWTASEAAEWARNVEKRYEARCRQKYECDAGGRYTGGQLEAAHLRQYFATGEGISQFLMIPRPGVESRTRLRLLPSHWLSRETQASQGLQQGVHVDRHGAPAGYRFRMKDAFGIHRDVDMRARDRFGRPIINHIFDGMPGQFRGITVFAPVLKTIRAYDRLSGSTLAAALIHAIFAATIESEYPSEEVLGALVGEPEKDQSPFAAFMGEKAGWHQNVDIKLGSYGKIPHLVPGEKLTLQGSKHPNANYEAQANFLLREIARCLGCLFEDLTGDYRGATYSSLQNGIAKIWPIALYRRQHIAVPFKQADYEAWLEDEIDGGRIPFPGGVNGFVENRAAVSRAEYRGPPKPVADELKAAKSDQIYYRLGVKPQARIAADRGDDIEDVHEQLARERESRQRHELPEPLTSDQADADAEASDSDERDAA